MSTFEIDRLVRELHGVRALWRDARGRTREPRGREFPSRAALVEIIDQLKGALFPMRLGPLDLRHDNEDVYVAFTLDAALHGLLTQARLELHWENRGVAAPCALHADTDETAAEAIRDFASALPDIRRRLDDDVLAAFHGDPAARGVDEVLLCYPGVQALIHHRIAHRLHTSGLPLIARIIAEIAHGETGIDIHPGAIVGRACFIDHGTGVVIGETAVLGERVRIYQAVTLGAKRFPTDAEGRLRKGLPRHPVVEDDVVLYAGATVLGRVTIGRGATIGGNVWLTEDVPAGAAVTQASLQSPTSPHPSRHRR